MQSCSVTREPVVSYWMLDPTMDTWGPNVAYELSTISYPTIGHLLEDYIIATTPEKFIVCVPVSTAIFTGTLNQDPVVDVIVSSPQTMISKGISQNLPPFVETLRLILSENELEVSTSMLYEPDYRINYDPEYGFRDESII